MACMHSKGYGSCSVCVCFCYIPCILPLNQLSCIWGEISVIITLYNCKFRAEIISIVSVILGMSFRYFGYTLHDIWVCKFYFGIYTTFILVCNFYLGMQVCKFYILVCNFYFGMQLLFGYASMQVLYFGMQLLFGYTTFILVCNFCLGIQLLFWYATFIWVYKTQNITSSMRYTWLLISSQSRGCSPVIHNCVGDILRSVPKGWLFHIDISKLKLYTKIKVAYQNIKLAYLHTQIKVAYQNKSCIYTKIKVAYQNKSCIPK